MTSNERYAMAKGILIGFFPTLICCVSFFLSIRNDNKKEYPIEVKTTYKSGDYYYSGVMYADSVKSDTIYKDGLLIVNKNIVNVTFK